MSTCVMLAEGAAGQDRRLQRRYLHLRPPIAQQTSWLPLLPGKDALERGDSPPAELPLGLRDVAAGQVMPASSDGQQQRLHDALELHSCMLGAALMQDCLNE